MELERKTYDVERSEHSNTVMCGTGTCVKCCYIETTLIYNLQREKLH